MLQRTEQNSRPLNSPAMGTSKRLVPFRFRVWCWRSLEDVASRPLWTTRPNNRQCLSR
jgi:hypothetical protein